MLRDVDTAWCVVEILTAKTTLAHEKKNWYRFHLVSFVVFLERGAVQKACQLDVLAAFEQSNEDAHVILVCSPADLLVSHRFYCLFCLWNV